MSHAELARPTGIFLRTTACYSYTYTGVPDVRVVINTCSLLVQYVTDLVKLTLS